jgi:hypothetical protein
MTNFDPFLPFLPSENRHIRIDRQTSAGSGLVYILVAPASRDRLLRVFDGVGFPVPKRGEEEDQLHDEPDV